MSHLNALVLVREPEEADVRARNTLCFFLLVLCGFDFSARVAWRVLLRQRS